jgi:hypothetical protein
LVLKKPAPTGFKVPQTIGISGWLILTYDKLPKCIWVSGNECYTIPVCIDERLFGDTFLKVERVNDEYIISDIFMYNSCCVFACTTFIQRYEWTKQLMSRFFHDIPGFPKLIHKSDSKHKIKGYETYTDIPGSKGYYEESGKTTLIKSDIPDVYFIEGTESYIQVPDLKTSVYLRSLGDTFELDLEEKEDLWFVKENIPNIE